MIPIENKRVYPPFVLDESTYLRTLFSLVCQDPRLLEFSSLAKDLVCTRPKNTTVAVASVCSCSQFDVSLAIILEVHCTEIIKVKCV